MIPLWQLKSLLDLLVARSVQDVQAELGASTPPTLHRVPQRIIYTCSVCGRGLTRDVLFYDTGDPQGPSDMHPWAPHYACPNRCACAIRAFINQYADKIRWLLVVRPTRRRRAR